MKEKAIKQWPKYNNINIKYNCIKYPFFKNWLSTSCQILFCPRDRRMKKTHYIPSDGAAT